jgi:hypothetical protein
MMLFFRAAPFAIALLAVPALAANPATSDNAGQSSQTTQPAPKKAKEKKVCVSETSMGSRFATKICRTQSEWDQIRAQDREGVEDSRGEGRNR